MKLFLSSMMIVLFSTLAFAGTKILNWTSTEVSESDAAQAVQMGVKIFVEDDNDCELVNVWGLEAVNNLKDYYGNPLIVVNSIVETRGPSCKLEKYQDCNTVFVRQDGNWKYDDTTCDKEESPE
jgi:hypothetical protein